MSYEDRVVELLAWADPAREQPSYRAVEGDAYLTAIQTISIEALAPGMTQGAAPEPGREVKWLAVAMVIAVLTTVGILLFTVGDQPPAATTPSIEELEPVPTTDPVPTTTPPTDPEMDSIGTSGRPLFNGQTEPGDYEWAFPALHILMTSDGNWKCVNLCNIEEEFLQSNGGFIIRSSVPGGAAAFSDLDLNAEDAREVFASESGVAVGELEPFQPTHPDANWTGFRFLVDIRADAAMSSECQGSVDYGTYPCVVVRFGGWATGDNGITVHGPTMVYILAAEDGQTIFGSSFWFPWPLPPEGDHEALNEHLEELIGTLRFVD